MKTTTLSPFTRHDVTTLQFAGWRDNSAHDGKPEFGATEGYHWQDYFSAEGEYLGQDKYAIEPLFDTDEPAQPFTRDELTLLHTAVANLLLDTAGRAEYEPTEEQATEVLAKIRGLLRN